MRVLFVLVFISVLLPCRAQDSGQSSKTAIVYISRHGTTEKVAFMIGDSLGRENVDIYNLKELRNPDIGIYRQVIIGGSIHNGRVQHRLSRFCRKNEDALLTMDVGLYICCLAKGERATEEFNNAYPESLRKHARAKAFMGYELYFEKMNPLYRHIMKKISGETSDVSRIDMNAIAAFINEMKN